MATNKNTTAPEETQDQVTGQTQDQAPEVHEDSTAPVKKEVKRVSIHIPRAEGNDEKNLLVSVNGVNYLLPKGQTSEVPEFVAKEIQRSWKAQDRYDQRVNALKEAAKQ